MNVLSLFDGMSCGRVALERVGVTVGNYFASEIDKHAIKVATANYPDIIQLGDISKWQEWDIDFGSIDLLLAGFPCQAWSVAGKQKGDNDPRGALVHDLIAVWQKIKEKNPNVKFLFENVKMKKEFLDYINDLFGVEPILINSALLSAQNRKRYYWTNIADIDQPEDKGIMLKDIVHKGVDVDEYKVPLDDSFKLLDKEVEKGKVGYFHKDSQTNRVYFVHDKAVTLCGCAGGGATKMGQYLFGCITPGRLNKRQNGQRFSKGEKFYTLTAQDKHGILTEGYIRKLTPVECERLQTLDDGYTDKGVSNAQRYKMIGNGWTVSVIEHIFKTLQK